MRLLFLILPFLTVAGSPALAHDEEHHGLPGALHSVSADHSGWILLGAVILLGLFALRKPILTALRVRSRK